MRAIKKGAVLAALLALPGCGGRGPEPTEPATPGELARVQAAPVVAAPRSCLSTVAPSQHKLMHATQVMAIGERTFAVLWRGTGAEVETVIASLDANGGLVETPVPVPYAEPQAVGSDAQGLVIVSVAPGGPATLVRVALGDDGALLPAAPVRLPEVAWGWPMRVGSDGTRVTLHHAISTPDQTIGGEVTYMIEMATGKVLSKQEGTAGTSTHCHAGGCTTATVTREGAASLTRRGPEGEARLELRIASGCPAVHALPVGDDLLLVAPGDPWRAVLSAEGSLRALAIDRSLAPVPDCGGALSAFPSKTRPGLVERGSRTLRVFAREKAMFGAAERLPELAFPRWEHTGHTDGVIEVAWNGGSGMMHSPTDAKGTRRYFKRWHFNGGQVALLRHEEGRWQAREVMPLALKQAEGQFHEGYHPLVLRHGRHAAVLLVPQGGGDPAWLQPYLAPCDFDDGGKS